MEKNLTADDGLQVDLLDHAGEFVARVAQSAPAEYQRLLARDDVRTWLAADNPFNPGKLYVWAEFRVFRREFRQRFPGADERACLNAFCRLFLKNDISLSNLAAWMERGGKDDPRRALRELAKRS